MYAAIYYQPLGESGNLQTLTPKQANYGSLLLSSQSFRRKLDTAQKEGIAQLLVAGMEVSEQG